MKSENNRAYLYARVNGGAECGSALDLQRKELEQFCVEKGYEISGFTGVVGTAVQGKEEIDRLLERAEAQHDFDVVLAVNSSRLAVDPVNVIRYIRAFNERGVAIECTHEDLPPING